MLVMDLEPLQQLENQHHWTRTRLGCNKILLQCLITWFHQPMFKWQCNSSKWWWWIIKIHIQTTTIHFIISKIITSHQILHLLLLTHLVTLSLLFLLLLHLLLSNNTTIIICSFRKSYLNNLSLVFFIVNFD